MRSLSIKTIIIATASIIANSKRSMAIKRFTTVNAYGGLLGKTSWAKTWPYVERVLKIPYVLNRFRLNLGRYLSSVPPIFLIVRISK